MNKTANNTFTYNTSKGTDFTSKIFRTKNTTIAFIKFVFVLIQFVSEINI